jgi:hypothetical protein
MASGADRPARLDEGLGVLDERAGVGARERDATDRRLLFVPVLLDQLARLDDHPLALPVVARAERGDRPQILHGLEQREVVRRPALVPRRQAREQAPQIVGEGADLLLLALEAVESAGLTGLQIEDALTSGPDRARREVVRCLEVEDTAIRS